MSGETEADVSAWTIDSAKAHLLALMAEKDKRDQQRFDAQSDAINAALQSAEKAVTKAEVAAERRFDSVNEFRDTLRDQATTFVNRAELAALNARLSDLAARVDRNEGQSSGTNATVGYFIAAGGVIIAIAAIVVSVVIATN